MSTLRAMVEQTLGKRTRKELEHEVDWVIYYDDREPCSSKDYTPDNVPRRGVQAILQDESDVGVEIVTAGDYYVWYKGRWHRRDIIGLWDYLVMPGWKVVLFGRMILKEEYAEIIRAVMEMKAGWLAGEFKPQ